MNPPDQPTIAPTPRTDAARYRYEDSSGNPCNAFDYVEPEDMATLERELAAAKAECERLTANQRQPAEEIFVSNLSAELTAASQAYECAMAIHGTVMEERDRLATELANAKKECEELRSVNATGAERLRFVLGENSHLRADRTYNHECINRLASATGALGESSEKVVDIALSTINRLRAEVTELQDRLDTSMDHHLKYRDYLREDLSTAHSENEQLKEEINQARRAWLGDDYGHLPLIEAMEKFRNDREAEFNKLESDYNQLVASDNMVKSQAESYKQSILNAHAAMDKSGIIMIREKSKQGLTPRIKSIIARKLEVDAENKKLNAYIKRIDPENCLRAEKKL
jgi:FtsZ-binding cell division protein ZapB